MREGYKETAVGWIPEDWEVVKLGDVLVRSPEYGAGAASIPYSDETYRYVRITDIDDSGKIIEENKVGIVKEDGEQYLLRERDVLIARTGNTVGKSYFHNPKNGDCAFAGYLIRFNLDEKKYNPYFFFHFVHSPMYWIWVRNTLRTGAQPNINSQEYQGLKLPRPPLAEQSKIASILSTVDDKIDSINKRIEETRKLKQGLMQRLLTQGIGHTKFKDSPLGRIPEGWEVVRICDIAEVKGGKRLPKGESLVEQQTPYPYIRVSDMFMGGINPINILYVPESIQKTIRRYTIGKDDLFISVAGTLGLVGKIPPELDGANLTENADKLTNIKCNRSYLLQVLMSNIIQNSIQNESTSNAQPKLALTRIQQFEIPLPSLPEQSKIASILSSTDMKVENLTRINSEYEQLKKSLMQQLLTGRMRVIANRSSKYI